MATKHMDTASYVFRKNQWTSDQLASLLTWCWCNPIVHPKRN
jgi:hypothetical protein